ncbi:LacI family DNA-binding transcriptional regulator [Sphingobium chungangianum]
MVVKRGSRRRTEGPTVADVAHAAGVSPMTVSRVINHDQRVKDTTRKKVEVAVAALGYVPNAAARALAGARQCRIVLLYGNPSAAYLSEFLLGSLGSARENDVELIVDKIDPLEKPVMLAARLVAHRVDAVLLPPPLCDDAELLSALQKCGLAAAQVASGQPAPSSHAVLIDDEEAAFTMTQHILARGHRRIGFVAGDPNQTASHLRRQGYERALHLAGIKPDKKLVAQGNFTYRGGLSGAATLLDITSPPSAIFAANDDMAAGVVSAAHQRGLDVPSDLTVCGFDDTAIATTIWPELTTIRQPISAMASVAIEILAQAVRSKRPLARAQPQHVKLDYELVVRGSDAAPQLKT